MFYSAVAGEDCPALKARAEVERVAVLVSGGVHSRVEAGQRDAERGLHGRELEHDVLSLRVVRPGVLARPDQDVHVRDLESVQLHHEGDRDVRHDAVRPHLARGLECRVQVVRRAEPVLRLGVTATPARLDGHGLGNHFDTLIQGPTVAELSELGFLSPCRVFAPPTVDTSGLRVSHGDYLHGDSDELINRRAITGSALEHYKKHAGGKRALVFAISVKHAEAIAAQFREDGYSSVHLHGGTAAEIRRGCVKDFHEGRLQILASCDLFSEGFDCPGAEVGIMLRPTTSLALYRQQCGRILRPSPGKPFALLLDHVGNSSRHGLPDDPIEWQLSTETVAKVERTSVKICPECFAALPVCAQVCECGHSFALVKKPRRIEERDGELVEVEGVSRRDQANATTLEQLREYAKRKGYHLPGA